MANSFRLESKSQYDGRKLVLYCTQKIDVKNNQSTITWKLSSEGGNVNYYSTGPTNITINGQLVYTNGRIEAYEQSFPASKGTRQNTIIVKHNLDGKKTISVSLSTAIYTGNVTASYGNWVLDDIPQKAELTFAPNFTDEQVPTIYYNVPKGLQGTVEACISIDGPKDDIPYREIPKDSSSYTFVLTENQFDLLRNSTPKRTREIQFIIRTTIGKVVNFSSAKKQFTVTETDNTKPTTTVAIEADNTAVLWLPDAYKSLYLQKLSKLKATFTASAKYNASIDKYSVTGNGISASGKNNVVTTSILQYGGNTDVISTVTDTRGYIATVTNNINIIPYAFPFVSAYDGENGVICRRCDSSGVPADNGIFLLIRAKRSYSPVIVSENPTNKCRLEYRVKEKGGLFTDWRILLAEDESSDSVSKVIPDTVADVSKSYTVEIRAKDRVSTSHNNNAPLSYLIPTDEVAFHLGEGGKNAAFGKYCDTTKQNLLESAWQAKFYEGYEGNNTGTYAADVLDFSLNCKIGITAFKTDKSTTNKPDTAQFGNFNYSMGAVVSYYGFINTYLFELSTGNIVVNSYNGTNWSGWHLLTANPA